MRGLVKPRGRCPSCGSKDIARILYGYPAYDEDLKDALDKGTVVLGGCMPPVPPEPNRHCRSCDYEWRQTRHGPVATLARNL